MAQQLDKTGGSGGRAGFGGGLRQSEKSADRGRRDDGRCGHERIAPVKLRMEKAAEQPPAQPAKHGRRHKR